MFAGDIKVPIKCKGRVKNVLMGRKMMGTEERYYNRLHMVGYTFARSIVFREWLEKGKITKADLYVNDMGQPVFELTPAVPKALSDELEAEAAKLASTISYPTYEETMSTLQ